LLQIKLGALIWISPVGRAVATELE
jgi:hypothetical protein